VEKTVRRSGEDSIELWRASSKKTMEKMEKCFVVQTCWEVEGGRGKSKSSTRSMLLAHVLEILVRGCNA
jgi:hypothetical protein